MIRQFCRSVYVTMRFSKMATLILFVCSAYLSDIAVFHCRSGRARLFISIRSPQFFYAYFTKQIVLATVVDSSRLSQHCVIHNNSSRIIYFLENSFGIATNVPLVCIHPLRIIEFIIVTVKYERLHLLRIYLSFSPPLCMYIKKRLLT